MALWEGYLGNLVEQVIFLFIAVALMAFFLYIGVKGGLIDERTIVALDGYITWNNIWWFHIFCYYSSK